MPPLLFGALLASAMLSSPAPAWINNDSVSKPVFIADSGRIKRIETCLGTGESYYRAMAQIGYKDWANKNLVVFGSGKVGTGLITYAHKMGAHVYVVTRPDDASDLVKSISVKVIDCHDAKQIEEVLVLADAVALCHRCSQCHDPQF